MTEPNISLVTGKHVTSLANNNQRLSVYDKLKNIVDEVRKNHQSVKEGHYLGCILDTVKREVSYLKERFGEQSVFYMDVIKEHGMSKVPPGAELWECRVHIPELTGMLPWPKQSLMNAAKEDPAETADEVSDAQERAKNYPDRVAAATPELLKLALYPKFYFFKPDAGAPLPGQMCIVKFSDGIPTKGLGIYVETLTQNWAPLIDEELL